MGFYSILPLSSGVFVLGIGIFVLIKRYKDPLNILFFLFCFGTSIWLISTFFMFTAENEEMAIWWDRVVYLGAVFVPSFLYHFSLIFTGRVDKNKLLLKIAYFFSFIFLVFSRTSLFVTGLYVYDWGVHTKAQILHHFFILFLALLFVRAFYEIYSFYRISSGINREKAKYLFFAFVIFCCSSSFAVLTAYDVDLYPFVSYFSGIIYTSLITYAILRYRLFDIQVAFSRYLVAILLGAGVIGFDILFVKLLHPMIGYYFSGAIAMLIIGGVLFATPLSKKLQLGVDQMVLRGKYNYQNILREASRMVLTILNLDELINYIIGMLRQSLGVDRIAIFCRGEVTSPLQNYKLEYGYGVEEQLQNEYEINGFLVDWLEKKKEVFVKEEQRNILGSSEFSVLYGYVEKLGAELVVPLFHKGELEGILTLSAKGTGEPYVQSDIDLLEMLGVNISMAIRNARLYNEAVTDSLTGFYHHEYFQLRLFKEVEEAKSRRRFLSLLVIDLDQFKKINESYGSEVRDIVLKRLTIILRKNVEKTDIVFRYGSSGFAVILFGANSNLVAERLRKEVAREEFVVCVDDVGATRWVAQNVATENRAIHRIAPTSIKMAVSIGVACFDGARSVLTAADATHELIKCANFAMCRVKENGGNGVEVWS